MYTKPEDALHYVNETHVDALAVSIGTTHGQFKSKAKINYELLTELKAKLRTCWISSSWRNRSIW